MESLVILAMDQSADEYDSYPMCWEFVSLSVKSLELDSVQELDQIAGFLYLVLGLAYLVSQV